MKRQNITKFYLPEKIYIEKGAENYPLTRDLLERAKVSSEIISDKKKLLAEVRRAPDPRGWGKRFLLLAIDRGQAFKPFPIPEGTVPCDFYSLHLVEGCDFECSYCILQAYLTNPILTVYVNREEILDRLDFFLRSHPHQFFRIGTGQLADSLSLDHLTAHTESLVPFFARQPNAVLELKTKSVNIARLERLDSQGKTVVSWSMNTKKIQSTEEHKCATIKERIQAAKRCTEWGYPVGFHFDPVIDYEGCLQDYKEVMEEIFSRIPPEKVAWVSLGSLRFMPELKRIMEKRFPRSFLPCAEWTRGTDGKLRYLTSRRVALYKPLREKLSALIPKVPLYLCMETEAVWRQTFGEEATSLEISKRLDGPWASRMKSQAPPRMNGRPTHQCS